MKDVNNKVETIDFIGTEDEKESILSGSKGEPPDGSTFFAVDTGIQYVLYKDAWYVSHDPSQGGGGGGGGGGGDDYALDAEAVHKARTETITGVKTFQNPVKVGTPTLDGHAATKKYVDDAFAGGTLLTPEEKAVLDSVETGAEVNVIDVVKVNGVALAPQDKAVDISVPTSYGTGLSYSTSTGVLTLKDQDNTSLSTVTIPRKGTTGATLNTTTNVLTISLQDGSVVTVDLSHLKDVYTAGTGMSLSEGAFSLDSGTQSALSGAESHISDSAIHVTSADKTAWNGVADEAVRVTGNQTIAGAKSFSGTVNVPLTPSADANAVPKKYVDDAVSASVAGLALDSGVVHNAGNETIGGVKTFASPVGVPSPQANGDAVDLGTLITKLGDGSVSKIGTADVGSDSRPVKMVAGVPTQVSAALATDSSVVHIAGSEVVTGDKEFQGAVKVPTPTANSHAATKKYVDDAVVAGGGSTYSAGEGLTLDGSEFSLDSATQAALSDSASHIADTDIHVTSADKAAWNGILTDAVKTSGNQSIAGTKTFTGYARVQAPLVDSDASTKKYVDDSVSASVTGLAQDSAVVHLAGDEVITGDKEFTGSVVVPSPTASDEAVDLGTLTTKLGDGSVTKIGASSVGTNTAPVKIVDGVPTAVSADLALDSAVVHNAGNETVAGNKTFSGSLTIQAPTSNSNPATKKYVDDSVSGLAQDSTIVHTTGDEMIAGIKTFSSSPVVPAATESTDVVTKGYVDGAVSGLAQDSAVVHLAGTETVSGNKTFSGAVTVQTPTANSHAATKKYVDDEIAASGIVYTAEDGIRLENGEFSLDSTVSSTVSSASTHIADSTIHVTSADKAAWNGVATNAVRTSGDQSIDGEKTFIGTVIVPVPQTSTEAVNLGTLTTKLSDGSVTKIGASDLGSDTVPIKLVGGVPTAVENALAVDSGVVHKATAETISGNKTFTGTVIVPAPVGDAHASTKKYVDDSVSGLVSDAVVVHNYGDETVAGVKTFSDSPVVPAPVYDTDASTKKYVDDSVSGLAQDSATVHKAGTETITGSKTFSSATGVGTPTADGHAATKKYVDDAIDGVTYSAGEGIDLTSNEISLDSATQAALSISAVHVADSDIHVTTSDKTAWNGVASGAVRTTGDQTIAGSKTFTGTVNVPEPLGDDDAATKKYVDDAVSASGTTYTAGTGLSLSGNEFSLSSAVQTTLSDFMDHVSDSVAHVTASDKASWNSVASDAVRTSGDQTVLGVKTFSNNPVVPDPSLDGQAANKKYVDDAAQAAISGLAVDSQVVHKAGSESITGAKAFSGAVTVPSPTADGHAATKKYVDDSMAGVSYAAGTGLSLTSGEFSLSSATQTSLSDFADHVADTTVHVTASDKTAWNGVVSSAVKTSGDQTVGGVKTFTSPPVVPTPLADGDASTKKYVDDAVSGVSVSAGTGLDLTAGTMSLDSTTQTALSNSATHIADTAIHVTSADKLAWDGVVSNAVKTSGDQTVAGIKTFTGTVVVPTPTANTHASTKAYVDTAVGTLAQDSAVVHNTGAETVAGVKTFSDSPIVPTPTTDMQASTKKYVDDSVSGLATDSSVVHKTGAETVAGVKTFSSSPIVPTPTTDYQVATKKYVDDNAGGGGTWTRVTSYTTAMANTLLDTSGNSTVLLKDLYITLLFRHYSGNSAVCDMTVYKYLPKGTMLQNTGTEDTAYGYVTLPTDGYVSVSTGSYSTTSYWMFLPYMWVKTLFLSDTSKVYGKCQVIQYAASAYGGSATGYVTELTRSNTVFITHPSSMSSLSKTSPAGLMLQYR